MSALFKVERNALNPKKSPPPEKSPSPGRSSPRRLPTDPFHPVSPNHRLHKRIIVCCDGTWQDGLAGERSSYTNILRLARTINHEDERSHPLPAISQIVFYQTGIGSDRSLYSRYVEGTTGGSLGDKVEEAYGFIAHNYHPGDEVFLFGFSRGAYTARMVAMFIGAIGILNRTDMDHFASIFLAYQRLSNTENTQEIKMLKQQLIPWTQDASPGKTRVDVQGSKFTIKCLGVFDTVGSFGLPEELMSRSTAIRTMFGFPDNVLGSHVEYAYQALALNEMRVDFNCAKFEQTPEGRKKGQVLKQCWFMGSHSDIGGGYEDHDLSDLALTWMAAQVESILSLDTNYLLSIFRPSSPWGEHKFHDSRTGIFALGHSIQRPIPTTLDDVNCETIHASVRAQNLSEFPELEEVLAKHPEIVPPLLPLEQQVKAIWPTLLEICRPDGLVSKSDSEIGVATNGNNLNGLVSPATC